MAKIVGGVKDQYIGTMIRYDMDWVSDLKTNTPYPALAQEEITTSTWALAADSPTTDITLTGSSFDADLKVSWVSMEAGATVTDNSIVYLNNTITTTGIKASGDLTETTSTQRFIKQYRIRFRDC